MEEALKAQIHGVTDRGRVRERNEDALAWSEEGGWAVLADGMGGHMAGDVASRIAVETLTESLGEAPAPQPEQAEQALADAVAEANRRIHAQARGDARYHNMGSTLVAAMVSGDRLVSAHVGDSRLYRYRQGDLLQLSRDHSLVQELVDEGMLSREEAATSQHKNVITRALGLEERVEVELMQHSLQHGDTYLLCSDGLSDKLDEELLQRLLQRQGKPPEITQALVDEANARGGEDNISVIMIRMA